MSLEDFKPVLTALALPPASALLLMLFGWLLFGRRSAVGRLLWCVGLLLAWLLSCNASAVFLSKALLPQIPPTSVAQLKTQHVQAIVVLGGGMQRSSPEYGSAQLSAPSLVRLRYGAWLARLSGLPIAFSGGVGWANAGTSAQTEVSGARQAIQDFGQTLRWADDQSRDTAENAAHTRQLLQKDGVNRIALVTHSWHMPRAAAAFEAVGFTVVPAPMGFIKPESRDLLEWLPSVEGISSNRMVLREWLGLQVSEMSGWMRKQSLP